MEDEAVTTAALGRLQRAAFADGMLPEAHVIDDGESIAIRHWFAWPGAALGASMLLDRRGAWDAVRALGPGGPSNRRYGPLLPTYPDRSALT
jgi:hypothetical protein